MLPSRTSLVAKSFQEKAKGIKEVRLGTTREMGVCMYIAQAHACWKSATSEETSMQISGAYPKKSLKVQEMQRGRLLDQEDG